MVFDKRLFDAKSFESFLGIYVKVELNLNTGAIKRKKTSTKFNAADHIYNETFSFEVDENQMEKACIRATGKSSEIFTLVRQTKPHQSSTHTNGRRDENHFLLLCVNLFYFFVLGRSHFHDLKVANTGLDVFRNF